MDLGLGLISHTREALGDLARVRLHKEAFLLRVLHSRDGRAVAQECFAVHFGLVAQVLRELHGFQVFDDLFSPALGKSDLGRRQPPAKLTTSQDHALALAHKQGLAVGIGVGLERLQVTLVRFLNRRSGRFSVAAGLGHVGFEVGLDVREVALTFTNLEEKGIHFSQGGRDREERVFAGSHDGLLGWVERTERTKLSAREFARDLSICYSVDDNRQHMPTIKIMLEKLGLPEKSQSVYLDLLTHGPSAARALALRLGIPRSSLYDHVRPLLTLGLVCEEEHNAKAVFAIHDIADLDRLVAKEAESLALLRTSFAREKATITKAVKTSAEPRIKFVEGREGVAALLLEMLWDTKSEIKTVWPYQAMLKVLTPEDLELFNRKRIRQNIALKTIWTGPKPGAKHLWRGGDFKVDRRQAPLKYEADMAYNIYGDKVSFFSSAGEQYGFVVHSADFAKLMSGQFAALWEVSKGEK